MAVKLEVPSFGESITEVIIEEWLVNEGDYVKVDDPVVTIESDKATLEVPAPQAGVLSKILKKAGDGAAVGEAIAEIDTDADASDAGGDERASEPVAAEADEAERASEPPAAEADEAEQARAEEATGDEGDRGEAATGPAVRRLLAEHDLDASAVEATGKGGRLLKEDVLRHIEQHKTKKARERREPSTPSPSVPKPPTPDRAPDERGERAVAMSPIRKVIARRLVEATQTTAMLTTFNEIDMTQVMALRKRYRDSFVERHGVKLGFMSFFIKASVEALKAYPNVNAEVRDEEILYKEYYDIGVAVGSGKGLTVPVIRDADTLSFADIERTIADLAQRAQKNRLKLEELQGGTFTISNGGIYGSMLSTPILNPPQSGILGMHNILERPMVVDGEIVVKPMMYVALTYDHRIVDGREAVGFLYRIKETVEDPERLLLEV